MRDLLPSCSVLFLVMAVVLVSPSDANALDEALTITLQSPQNTVAGQNFNLTLAVQGGFAPYTWRCSEGSLPPGLKLHPHKGVISGVPTTPGEYHFKLAVTDSNIPHQQAEHDLTIVVIAGVTVDWKQPPKVQGTAIAGSALVSNQTGRSLDVTVIVVAVNSIGRATALGYQHFNLAAGASSPEIPFGSSPGPGTYTIRVDVAAHHKSGHHIFRASKQTDSKLEVTQF